MIRDAIESILSDRDLTKDEAAQVMEEIMSGSVSPVLTSAYLIALRKKGESVYELTGSVCAMRRHSLRIELDGLEPVDVCGTGGDGKGTFNISTITAFVVAAAGLPVAKHGNRAASSKCGSADLLEYLGAKISLSPRQVALCIQELGVGFLFAPQFHPAMRNVAPVRRELGVRTIFNLIGPLANPVDLKVQLLGVFSEDLVELFANVLRDLGRESACIVHGSGGYDEATTTSVNKVLRLCRGEISSFMLDPREYGFRLSPPESLTGGSDKQNAEIAIRVLSGEEGPCKDTVLLNAGLALLAAERAPDLSGALALAREAIDSGKAKKLLDKFVKFSKSVSGDNV